MYRSTKTASLLLAASICILPVRTSADTITVCASGCEYPSINAAIAVATDGDVIQLAAETYSAGEQIDTLGKAITLRGVPNKAGEPASILDGVGSHRVLICRASEGVVVLENLLLANGRDMGMNDGG